MDRRIFLASVAAACATPAAQAIEPDPPGDPRLAHHPDLQTGLALLRERRFRSLSDLLRGLPPDSACVLLGDISDQGEVDLDLDGLAAMRMGQTIAGALQVSWGWRYRGTGWGSSLTDEMQAAFSERLALAESNLQAAIAADPDDGVAFTYLLRTLTGAGDGDGLIAAWEGFLNAQRKPVRAFAAMANAFAAKWYGSHEMMLGFARTYQQVLAPASHGLIAQAFNEILFSLVRDGPEAAVAFASQPAVLGELNAANTAFNAGERPGDFYQANYCHSHFSFAFSYVGLADLALPHLREMEMRIGTPWDLLDDPFATLERARAAAGIIAT